MPITRRQKRLRKERGDDTEEYIMLDESGKRTQPQLVFFGKPPIPSRSPATTEKLTTEAPTKASVKASTTSAKVNERNRPGATRIKRQRTTRGAESASTFNARPSNKPLLEFAAEERPRGQQQQQQQQHEEQLDDTGLNPEAFAEITQEVFERMSPDGQRTFVQMATTIIDNAEELIGSDSSIVVRWRRDTAYTKQHTDTTKQTSATKDTETTQAVELIAEGTERDEVNQDGSKLMAKKDALKYHSISHPS